MTNVKLNIKHLAEDLQAVKRIAADSNEIDCITVCNLFMDLCEEISKGMILDPFTEEMAKRDNVDRSTKHNIAGALNRPTQAQIEAVKKEK